MSLSTQLNRSTENSSKARLVLGVVLGVWFLAVAQASYAGWLITPPNQPTLAILIAVLLPILLFVAAYGVSESFRNYVRSGDPLLLTYLQSWRVLGGVFLVLMTFGMLPAPFAIPAGWGDVAIGVTAPFVARYLAERGARAGRVFIAWQLLGIFDLVVAVGTGASLRMIGNTAADAEQMIILSQLPLSLIPTFAVPLFVILHIAAIVQYHAAYAHDEQREPAGTLVGGVS